MKRLLPLAAILLGGCASVPPAKTGPTAGFGEVAGVGGVQVRPLRIVEDSRCPVNVVCVWAGRLRVEAEVDALGGSETHRTVLTLQEPIALGGGTLTMVEAQPVKLDAPIDPRTYRFTFSFAPSP
jgi:hypothetical protein